LHTGPGPDVGTLDAALTILENAQDENVAEISKQPYYSLSAEQLEFMDYAGYVRDYNSGQWQRDPDVGPAERRPLIVALTIKKAARYVGDWVRSVLGSGGTPALFRP
jgi:hypothetical protein